MHLTSLLHKQISSFWLNSLKNLINEALTQITDSIAIGRYITTMYVNENSESVFNYQTNCSECREIATTYFGEKLGKFSIHI